jgi:hypothetical protein
MKRRETRSRRLTEALAVAGLMVGMTGCPQPMQDTPDVRMSMDAGVDAVLADVGVDAFVPPDAVFDAGPPDAAGPPCTTPGSMRLQPCQCGSGFTRRETCIAGSWRVTEPCNYPPTLCEPGSTRPYTTRCAVGIQRCTPPVGAEGCEWGPPELTSPEGECFAGGECGPGNICVCRADCTCPIFEGGVCLP